MNIKIFFRPHKVNILGAGYVMWNEVGRTYIVKSGRLEGRGIMSHRRKKYLKGRRLDRTRELCSCC
jgi:hypothetical protein